jgi:hypothetical protein
MTTTRRPGQEWTGLIGPGPVFTSGISYYTYHVRIATIAIR